LDSTIVNGLYFDEVTFDEVTENNLIKCYTKFTSTYNTIYFYSDGSYLNHTASKCVIFPKGKTTWEGFIPPCRFKDGDVISDALATCIFKREGRIKGTVDYYCGIHDDYFCVKDNKRNQDGHYGCIVDYRLATEEEKQKLFDAIKANGYKWNEETKTLEKLTEPKFKVRDTIQDAGGYKVEITKVDIDEECYEYISTIAKGIGSIPFELQDEWELVPNKFDITTLKPFDKVLVRDGAGLWRPSLFGNDMIVGYRYFTSNGSYKECIPYEGNEHLLGTTNDCDEYYKTWV
jgi:hypothetical protein